MGAIGALANAISDARAVGPNGCAPERLTRWIGQGAWRKAEQHK